MKKIVTLVIITLALSNCGIEEFYFLPQLEDMGGWVQTQLDSTAEIRVPPIPSQFNSYSMGYKIFYRIYLSDNTGLFHSEDLSGSSPSSSDNRYNINHDLSSDYSVLARYEDRTSSLQMSESVFSNRNYYELYYENNNSFVSINNKLTNSGGTVNIRFNNTTNDTPDFSINTDTFPMARSVKKGTNILPNDRYFFWSTELTQVDSSTNVDVSNLSSSQTAYISMYIVAFGVTNMKSVYGKPFHVGIFKLPSR
ncbi:MAG: hypothetical protein LBI28_02065 [Treponema sp.]|jgi:hypothetical protein|nr:hypothetical protein [Treponema sp.]